MKHREPIFPDGSKEIRLKFQENILSEVTDDIIEMLGKLYN